MEVKITGSANGEIIAADDSVRRYWIAQLGGYPATLVRGSYYIDSRILRAEEALRAAKSARTTLYIVEPDEPAERLGQVRTGRIVKAIAP